jgi:hypothetical protein
MGEKWYPGNKSFRRMPPEVFRSVTSSESAFSSSDTQSAAHGSVHGSRFANMTGREWPILLKKSDFQFT